jgi:hypothetical protein
MYCPECGTDHHVADRIEQAELDRQVEIERIHANRDIKVAEIGARVAGTLAETENAIDTAKAEGIAEGMETALDAAAGGGQAAEPGDGAPIVVESPAAEPEPEEPEAPDMMPPVVDTAPSPGKKESGWWDGYR